MADIDYLWNEYDPGPKPLSAIGVIEAAAERIEDRFDTSCCGAIKNVVRSDSKIRDSVLGALVYYFAPPWKNCGDYWWHEDDRESRLIALAFLIAIIETDGLFGY